MLGLTVAVLDSGAVHLLLDAALLKELLLLTLYQASEHVGGLIYQRYAQIAKLLIVEE